MIFVMLFFVTHGQSHHAVLTPLIFNKCLIKKKILKKTFILIGFGVSKLEF